MEQNTKKGIAFAVLAAALYAINAPFSKLLLEFVPPTLMAGFLYIGAGVGMMVIAFIKKVRSKRTAINKIRITIHHSHDTFGHYCSNLSIIGVERYNCGQCFPA